MEGLQSLVHGRQRKGSQSGPGHGRLVRAALQHDAVPFLRRQQCLQLRQPQRQVFLALDQRAHPHDARLGLGHPALHLPLRRLRGSFQRHRRSQSVGEYSKLPGRLGQPLDRLQLRHGQFFKWMHFFFVTMISFFFNY